MSDAATAVSVEVLTDRRTVLARMAHGRANALGPPILEGLERAVEVAEAEGALTIVVASGLEGFFAAGADIKHMTGLDGRGFAAYGDQMRAANDRLEAFDGITIAAIDGLALGGGLEVALSCALRIATPGSRMGLPETKLGLIPGAGGTQRMTRLIGPDRALEIIATARQVEAEEALRIGLVTELAPAGGAQERALGLAAELAALSVPAVRSAARCVARAALDDPAAGRRFEADEINELFVSGEAAEGIAAFVERRPPVFAA